MSIIKNEEAKIVLTFRKITPFLLVTLFLVIFSYQAISSMRLKSLTFDEITRIPTGYSYVITGSYRMDFVHPPLIKVLAGLPLVFFNLPRPETFSVWRNTTDEFEFGKQFMDAIGPERERVIFMSRLSMVILSILMGICIFQWATKLWGINQGLFALFLYTFEPNIIAHSRLVNLDMGSTFFMLFSIFCLWIFVNSPSFKNLVFLGISLGLALLTKFNALILIPIFIVLIYIYGPKKKLSHFFTLLFLIFLICFFVIWLGYGFETGKILQEKQVHNTLDRLIAGYPQYIKQKIYFIGEHLILPIPNFLKGLGWLLYFTQEKLQSFLAGRHFRGGSLEGFLFAFFIKTPIPILMLFVITLIAKRKVLLSRNQIFLLAPLFANFALAPKYISLQLKYLLPIYPFLIIFISQIFDLKHLKKRKFKIVGIFFLSLWLLISTLNIYPHYLAYFNEFVGGPKNGYKYLVDSNLDWGQDLKLLKDYLDRNNIKEVKLAYFGTAEPDYYKINYQRLEPLKVTTGWIAVSATYLQGVHTVKDGYSWLKDYEPMEKIGYSIFVYHIK